MGILLLHLGYLFCLGLHDNGDDATMTAAAAAAAAAVSMCTGCRAAQASMMPGWSTAGHMVIVTTLVLWCCGPCTMLKQPAAT
jgi:hypothetical protein